MQPGHGSKKREALPAFHGMEAGRPGVSKQANHQRKGLRLRG